MRFWIELGRKNAIERFASNLRFGVGGRGQQKSNSPSSRLDATRSPLVHGDFEIFCATPRKAFGQGQGDGLSRFDRSTALLESELLSR
jgi:hypothetical protein